MTHTSTHLMFQDGRAREAAEFYVTLLPDSRIDSIDEIEGVGANVGFTLAGSRYLAVDSPPVHDFDFTPSMSIFVTCDDAGQLDALFARLADDGDTLMPVGDYGFSERFGWCRDRFGVSWQLTV